jgi:hypothetical protein
VREIEDRRAHKFNLGPGLSRRKSMLV